MSTLDPVGTVDVTTDVQHLVPVKAGDQQTTSTPRSSFQTFDWIGFRNQGVSWWDDFRNGTYPHFSSPTTYQTADFYPTALDDHFEYIDSNLSGTDYIILGSGHDSILETIPYSLVTVPNVISADTVPTVNLSGVPTVSEPIVFPFIVEPVLQQMDVSGNDVLILWRDESGEADDGLIKPHLYTRSGTGLALLASGVDDTPAWDDIDAFALDRSDTSHYYKVFNNDIYRSPVTGGASALFKSDGHSAHGPITTDTDGNVYVTRSDFGNVGAVDIYTSAAVLTKSIYFSRGGGTIGWFQNQQQKIKIAHRYVFLTNVFADSFVQFQFPLATVNTEDEPFTDEIDRPLGPNPDDACALQTHRTLHYDPPMAEYVGVQGAAGPIFYENDQTQQSQTVDRSTQLAHSRLFATWEICRLGGQGYALANNSNVSDPTPSPPGGTFSSDAPYYDGTNRWGWAFVRFPNVFANPLDITGYTLTPFSLPDDKYPHFHVTGISGTGGDLSLHWGSASISTMQFQAASGPPVSSFQKVGTEDAVVTAYLASANTVPARLSVNGTVIDSTTNTVITYTGPLTHATQFDLDVLAFPPGVIDYSNCYLDAISPYILSARHFSKGWLAGDGNYLFVETSTGFPDSDLVVVAVSGDSYTPVFFDSYLAVTSVESMAATGSICYAIANTALGEEIWMVDAAAATASLVYTAASDHRMTNIGVRPSDGHVFVVMSCRTQLLAFGHTLVEFTAGCGAVVNHWGIPHVNEDFPYRMFGFGAYVFFSDRAIFDTGTGYFYEFGMGFEEGMVYLSAIDGGTEPAVGDGSVARGQATATAGPVSVVSVPTDGGG